MTMEVLQKYAINTVMIASMDTKCKAIQVHHTAMQQCAAMCIRACGSQKCITL